MIKFKSNNPNDILEQLQKEICCLEEQIEQIVSGGVGWALTGNNLSTPTSFIGSTNLADFVVKTNSSERMRVMSNGLVGVNTSAPTALLDINGNVRIRGGSPGLGKVLTSDANGLATWEVLAIPPGGVTDAKSGLHLTGTVARLGGELLETAAISTTDPTKKVIFEGVVSLVNGDWTDAYVIYDVTGECPAVGINAENDGISINAGNNGINITGGIFGVNVVGETTGIVSVGNTQNGGDFSGLHGGVNVSYGRSTDQGAGTDFGLKVVAQGIGSKGTPILVQVPNFAGTRQNMIDLSQTTNASVTNGFGEAMRFLYSTPLGQAPLSINEIWSVWTNISTQEQAYQLWSATPNDLGNLQQTHTVYNNGQVQFNQYVGDKPFNASGTPRALVVDTGDGKIYTTPVAVATVTNAESGVRLDVDTVKLGGQLLETASIPITDPTINISISGVNTSSNSPTLSVATTGSGGIAIRGTATSGTGYGVMGVAANVFNSAGVYAQSSGPAAALIANNSTSANAIYAQSAGMTIYANTRSASQTTAIYAESTLANGFTLGTGTGIDGRTGTGIGVAGSSQTAGTGVFGASGSGVAFKGVSGLKIFDFEMNNITAPPTGIHIVGSISKSTGGVVNTAAGFGLAIDYQLASSTALMRSVGQQQFAWSVSTDGSQTGQYNLVLPQAGTNVTPFTAVGNKGITMIGVTNFADTPFGFVRIQNTGTQNALSVGNLGAGPGLSVTTTGSAAILASGPSAIQASGSVTVDQSQENNVIAAPLRVTRSASQTNLIHPAIDVRRRTVDGTGGAVGFGSAIRFFAQLNNTLNEGEQARIYSTWIDPNDGAYDGDFAIATTQAGVSSRKLYINNLGQVTLDKYGVNTFAGTAAYILGVDATGNVVETSASGGASDWNAVMTAGANLSDSYTTTIAANKGWTINGSQSDGLEPYLLQVSNSAGGGLSVSSQNIGIKGESLSNGGAGVRGVSIGTNGNGVAGASVGAGGTAFFATTSEGILFRGVLSSATLNTILPVADYSREASGAATNGIGQSHVYRLKSATAVVAAAQFTVQLDNVADAAQTSSLAFWTINNGAALAKGIELKGNGEVVFNKYGVGTFGSDPARYLGVAADGTMVEVQASTVPNVEVGSGAPASTPAKVGNMYVDTTNKKLYFSVGTTSASDWEIAN